MDLVGCSDREKACGWSLSDRKFIRLYSALEYLVKRFFALHTGGLGHVLAQTSAFWAHWSLLCLQSLPARQTTPPKWNNRKHNRTFLGNTSRPGGLKRSKRNEMRRSTGGNWSWLERIDNSRTRVAKVGNVPVRCWLGRLHLRRCSGNQELLSEFVASDADRLERNLLSGQASKPADDTRSEEPLLCQRLRLPPFTDLGDRI